MSVEDLIMEGKSEIANGMKWVGPFSIVRVPATDMCAGCGELRIVVDGQYRATAPDKKVFMCHDCLLAYYLWMKEGEQSVKNK